MKVTGISTRVVNAALRDWIFVRVDTDQPGLYVQEPFATAAAVIDDGTLVDW